MRATLFVAVIVISTTGMACAEGPAAQGLPLDPRVFDRAAVDPEFFELAVKDPELAAVVAVASLPLPLPDNPEILDIIRGNYKYLPLPLPPDAKGEFGLPHVPEPLPPKGYLGTRTRLLKQDSKLLDAEKLLKVAPTPENRIAHYEEYLEQRHFLGWQVDIRDAKTVNGVTTVYVEVYPLVTTKNGIWITPATYVKETYELTSGMVKLVKFDASGPPAGSY